MGTFTLKRARLVKSLIKSNEGPRQDQAGHRVSLTVNLVLK